MAQPVLAVEQGLDQPFHVTKSNDASGRRDGRCAAEREKARFPHIPTEDSGALERGDAHRIVRPDATIEEVGSSVETVRRQVSRRSRGGERGIDHRHLPVHNEPLMMCSLENVETAVGRVISRNDDSGAGVADKAVAENSTQFGTQSVSIILGGAKLPHRAQSAVERGHNSGERTLAGLLIEDPRTAGEVEVEDFCAAQACSQGQCDDASGRSASDQVEVVDDALARQLLDLGDEGGGHRALQTAPVDGQNSSGIGLSFFVGTDVGHASLVNISADIVNSTGLVNTCSHSVSYILRARSHDHEEEQNLPLSTKLKELRARSRESLQQVADAVGVSKAHIWELERGTSKNPGLDLLKKLAEHFKVSIAFLSDDEQDENPAAQQFFREFGGELSTRDWDTLRTVAASLKGKAV